MKAYNPLSENQKKLSHTVGHQDCPACARDRTVLYCSLSADLHFSAAFEVWMSHRTIQSNGLRTNARYLAPKTERDYQVCAKALEKFFGKLRLDQIHEGHLMSYQNMRAVNAPDPQGHWRCVRRGVVYGDYATREEAEAWARRNGDNFELVQTMWAYPAGANCIRKEIALLIRILKGAKLWGDAQEQHFARVQAVETEIERAMTLEEQHRFLHVAASREEFRFMYQYAIVALQTTAGTNEMRSLRLGDIYLQDRFIQIPRAGAKNKYRMRAIPLVTEDALWALEGLLARARELGSTGPAHYLFPVQVARTHYDPTTPMTEYGLKKPWDRLRCAAGLPKLRLYDLRHTGITRMAEAGVPLRVAMTFAGHMTERMQQRYESICMAAKRGWGAAVWGSGMERAAVHEAGEAAGAWGGRRKPVLSDELPRYQEVQHFHKRA